MLFSPAIYALLRYYGSRLGATPSGSRNHDRRTVTDGSSTTQVLGLRSRDSGLIVRCSVRFPVATSYDFMIVPAEIRCSRPRLGAVPYRALPGWNATAEQTWSKHRGGHVPKRPDTFRNNPW